METPGSPPLRPDLHPKEDPEDDPHFLEEHLDPSSLPRLASSDFMDIFEWHEAVEAALRPFRKIPKFDAARLVDPDIIFAWSIIHEVEARTFPSVLQETADALLSTFRPPNHESCLTILRRFSYTPPEYKVGTIALVSLAQYSNKYRRIVKALGIPDTLAIKAYVASLRGPFGKIVAAELEFDPPTTIGQCIATAYVRARVLDSANSSGIMDLVPKSRPTPELRPRPPQFAKFGKLGRPAGSQAVSPIPKLSPEERTRCVRDGLCLRCRQPGHSERACPRFATLAPSPPTAPPNPPCPVAPANSLPTPSQIPPSTPRLPVDHPAMLRRSLRNRIPRQPFTPSHAVECAAAPPSTHQPQTPPSPEPQTPAETHSVAAHGALPSPLPIAPNRLTLDVPVCLPSGRSTPMCCVLDTGADRSVIGADYAASLGLTQTQASPVVLEVANGGRETCSTEVVVPLSLAVGAPLRPAHIVVSQTTPPGPYALLGLADLRGYAITLGAAPAINWMGDAAAADVADPIHLPDPFDNGALSTGAPPMVKIGEHLTEDESARIRGLLMEYRDVFGPLDARPADFRAFSVVLKPGTTPIRQRARFLSAVRRDFVKAQVAKLLDLGIIRSSTSPWASPLVITTKHNGDLRMCVDYRQVNAATIRDAGPIPFQRDLFEFVAGKPFMASFDMTMGYYQIPITPSSIPILAFTTPLGLYEWTRLPFGPTNGPPHFQREVSSWLAPLRDVRSFFDDIVCAAATFAAFLVALGTFFGRCRHANVRLNAAKSVIGPSLLPYLGRLVGPDAVRIDPTRIEPLRNALAPYDRPTLRSFLGLAQWFAPFVPHFTSLANPLWDLLGEHAAFEWRPEHLAAFERVRDAILSAEILDQPIPGRPLKLWSDASTIGLGGVLLQQRSNELWGVLAFFSRKLTSAETRYCTIELEALAIVFCLDRGRPLIHGPILIQTDHSNLQFLESSANRRVQRWALFIHDFDATIEYRPGRTNEIADFLSRALAHEPHSSVPFPTLTIAEATSFPPTREGGVGDLAEIIRDLPHTLRDGIIVLAERPPPDVVARVFVLAHDDPLSGHAGAAVTAHHVRSAITWPGVSADIRRLCAQCALCQKLRALPPRPAAMASTRSRHPFESVFADYLGPIRESNGQRFVLVMICRFSHWLELVPTPDTLATTTANAFLSRWVCAHGAPTLVTTDGGASFAGSSFHESLRLLHISHHISAPLHPEGHGSVERANHQVMDTLRALFRHRTTWHDVVAPATFAINSAPSRVLGMRSAFEVAHGFSPRLVLNSAIAAQRDEAIADDDPLSFAEALASHVVAIYQEVRDIQSRLHKQALDTAAEAAKGQVDFNVGDFVLLYSPRPDKICLEWQGPFQVVSRESPTIYIVEDLKERSPQRVPVTRLHRFRLGSQSPDDLVAEAARDGEFYVEDVSSHTFRDDGELWLFVKWLGFPAGNRDDPDSDSWVRYRDSRFAPLVRAYVKKHGLRVGADGRRKHRLHA